MLFIIVKFVSFILSDNNEILIFRDSACDTSELGLNLECSSWKKFPTQIQSNRNQDENVILNQTVGLVNLFNAYHSILLFNKYFK